MFATIKAFAVSLALGGALVMPVLADQQQCSCKNLQSVQEELRNADYAAKFFADMAAQLKAVEDPLIEAHKIPTHPDSNVSIYHRSSRKRAEIRPTFQLPHRPAHGYKGPATVDMDYGSCEQKPAMLEALRAGSQCKELADFALEHEAIHRAKCARDTAAVYWDRLPSHFAAEEAERYREQAKATRALLKRIIDEGTVTIEAKLEPRISGPQFDVTYSYITQPAEMDGNSSPGSDTWTLKGKARRAGKIKSVKLGGMSCTPSGQINDDIDLALKLDGLTMGLDSKSKGKPGDIMIRCKGGHGMSMRPQGEVDGGNVFADEAFTIGTDVSQDVRSLPFAKYVPSGMSVSGKNTVSVKLVCPGS
ncbi:hypothetical protein QEZ47_26330 [Aminobacter anthyllidis]|uniref:hypothetical protein n=1 Tax=Aminobacter anthyllidis TaxID=1035067 RepID=UPI00245424BA|nr:hypothetical protein [Aminobacter anthyllidis]MDH4988966.1 hypothetical protein [Aminobacter anthyllidis]